MYGKIFDSIYDGTIAVNWKAMVTFQQLIVLSDSQGVVDMTPPAISRRTGIPIDIIEVGLEYLEQPDPYSRSQAEDGKRIVLLEEDRPWGWRIVNHKHYRNISTKADKQEYDKKRYQQQKSGKAEDFINSSEANMGKESFPQTSTDSTHADADANKYSFEHFWKKYPRKKNKDAALRAFKKRKPNTFLLNQMFEGLEKAKQSPDWMKEDGRFIPYPATWLNAGGWKDGLEDERQEAEIHQLLRTGAAV